MESQLLEMFASSGLGGLALLVVYLLVKDLIKHLRESSKEVARAINGTTSKIDDVGDVVMDTNHKVTTLVERDK